MLVEQKLNCNILGALSARWMNLSKRLFAHCNLLMKTVHFRWPSRIKLLPNHGFCLKKSLGLHIKRVCAFVFQQCQKRHLFVPVINYSYQKPLNLHVKREMPSKFNPNVKMTKLLISSPYSICMIHVPFQCCTEGMKRWEAGIIIPSKEQVLKCYVVEAEKNHFNKFRPLLI